MNKVWLTGDAVVDLIPETSTTYLKCPGGAPANVAVGIARLGGDCAFFGRVGQDPFGVFMRKTLGAEGVDVAKLQLDQAQRTSTVLVDLDNTGERTFTFMVKPSADQFVEKSDVPTFTAGEWLHTCSISLANEPSRSSTLYALAAIKTAGGFVCFDPNLREEVWRDPSEIKHVVMQAITLADVVKFSEEELLFLTDTTDLDSGLAAIESYNIPLVVITLGAKGALVVFNGQQRIISGISVEVVDTTGAGDAFVCGLLAQLSQHSKWNSSEVVEKAVRWGNICGALATTQKGAMTALPTRQALLALE
ncbi:aminoimidazole riboside kinase [Vibrio ichthyoenteri ATCC 700023]|uniref:Aminoimidazole riboside kinase n=1 Tax=Vibrio ichthyoenteri ATCC 700023 TaxID=870968 RepID=F9RZA1_9VIBR|nr:aminoimidazole riboside kinase [Vibrio ichthyoenteri]EGU45539.1 aminoimidazole riboside kinase [Vibrio ichthyoenteri ATCC 700023]